MTDPTERTIQEPIDKKWEAADTYLWLREEGAVYNVVAIFGDAEECAYAAKALNAYASLTDHKAEQG